MNVSGEKISVCLLTYNHHHVIESTIRSVLEQGCQGFEFVVSDDQSTDGTWELIQELARQDSRIRPVQTPTNRGMAGNANFAASQTTRPYIALLHHDDLYRPDLLEKWGGVMDRHPEVGFVFNPYGVHESDFVYDHPFSDEVLDGTWFLERHLLPRWGCPVRGTALIRRSAWEALGGMRERFGLLADVDLWMRLARRGPVGYVPEPVIAIRHSRPEDYPDTYTAQWSWPRQRLLYEIHGLNRDEYHRGLRWLYETAIYRTRVSCETFKWLGYAVVRRKPAMILQAHDGACAYDLPPLNWLRTVLRAVYSLTTPPTTRSEKA